MHSYPLELHCQTAPVPTFERLLLVLLVFEKEMTFFIEKCVFPVSIPPEFQRHVVVLLELTDCGPNDSILAIGCVDEIAFGARVSGFGAARMLQRGVDNDNGCRGKVIDGA